MRKFHVALALMYCIAPGLGMAQTAPTAIDGRAGVEAFNRAFDAATRHMDNAATLALWQDDGVSLLPSTPPIVGKPALAKFMDDVMASIPGGHMQKFESACFDINVSGDWATEWCAEHQLVQFANGKPPFEGWGQDAAGPASRQRWQVAPQDGDVESGGASHDDGDPTLLICRSGVANRQFCTNPHSRGGSLNEPGNSAATLVSCVAPRRLASTTGMVSSHSSDIT